MKPSSKIFLLKTSVEITHGLHSLRSLGSTRSSSLFNGPPRITLTASASEAIRWSRAFSENKWIKNTLIPRPHAVACTYHGLSKYFGASDAVVSATLNFPGRPPKPGIFWLLESRCRGAHRFSYMMVRGHFGSWLRPERSENESSIVILASPCRPLTDPTTAAAAADRHNPDPRWHGSHSILAAVPAKRHLPKTSNPRIAAINGYYP